MVRKIDNARHLGRNDFILFESGGKFLEGIVSSNTFTHISIYDTISASLFEYDIGSVTNIILVELDKLDYIELFHGGSQLINSFDSTRFIFVTNSGEYSLIRSRETISIRNSLDLVGSDLYNNIISASDYCNLRGGDVYELNGVMREGTILSDNYLSVYKGGSKFDGGGYDRHNTFIGGLDVRDNNDLALLPLPDDTFYLIPEIGLDNCMGNFVEDLN